MRKTLLLPFLLALPLSLACSADWKNKGDDPSGSGDDGPPGDDGSGDDGSGDDGGTDSGTDSGDDDTTPDPDSTDDDGDGYSEDDGDCDDGDADRFPGAVEECNGIDDDCDGFSDADEDADDDGISDCEDFCPVQVDLSAADGGDGSFAAPTRSVQDGIDIAGATGCAEVDVWPGTYVENIDYVGFDVDVRAVSPGYATVLDGGAAGSVVTIASGEGSGAKLRGFTVTNGAAERGGGVHVDGASPVISDNTIEGNVAMGGSELGGGVYLYDSDGELLDNVIQDNDAGMGGDDDGSDGGGVAVLYGAPLIQGNQVLDNTAGDGGGLWAVRTDAVIVHNLFDGNIAEDTGEDDDLGYALGGQGGGVDLQTDTVDVWFSNNILSNNFASTHGGGLALIGFYTDTDVADATVHNNVIAFNSVGDGGYGGGIVVWGYSAPDLRNNLVHANDGGGVYLQYDYAQPAYNATTRNDVDWTGAGGDLTGTDGNISDGPGLAGVTDDGDPSDDNWRLSSGSPLRDAGDPAIDDEDGSRSDIGAYGGPDGGW